MNMNNFLISENELREKDSLIKRLIDQSNQRFVADATDDFNGMALRYAMLFSNPNLLLELGFAQINNTDRFYNEYYWFSLFSKLHQIKHGYDAGIEQQVFKILERAPSDVDWKLVDSLNKRVDEETYRRRDSQSLYRSKEL